MSYSQNNRGKGFNIKDFGACGDGLEVLVQMPSDVSSKTIPLYSTWASATAYAVGQYIQTGGFTFRCTAAGTSGTTAPVASQVIGSGGFTNGSTSGSPYFTITTPQPHGLNVGDTVKFYAPNRTTTADGLSFNSSPFTVYSVPSATTFTLYVTAWSASGTNSSSDSYTLVAGTVTDGTVAWTITTPIFLSVNDNITLSRSGSAAKESTITLSPGSSTATLGSSGVFNSGDTVRILNGLQPSAQTQIMNVLKVASQTPTLFTVGASYTVGQLVKDSNNKLYRANRDFVATTCDNPSIGYESNANIFTNDTTAAYGTDYNNDIPGGTYNPNIAYTVGQVVSVYDSNTEMTNRFICTANAPAGAGPQMSDIGPWSYSLATAAWKNSSNWSNVGTNVWSITLPDMASGVAINSIIIAGNTYTTMASSSGTVTGATPWYWNSTNKVLYIYSTTNPWSLSSLRTFNPLDNTYWSCRNWYMSFVPEVFDVKLEGTDGKLNKYVYHLSAGDTNATVAQGWVNVINASNCKFSATYLAANACDVGTFPAVQISSQAQYFGQILNFEYAQPTGEGMLSFQTVAAPLPLADWVVILSTVSGTTATLRQPAPNGGTFSACYWNDRLVTKVTAVPDSTHVTLRDNLSTNAANKLVTIWRDEYIPITNAINAAMTNGGYVYAPNGIYNVPSESTLAFNSISLRGEGAAIFNTKYKYGAFATWTPNADINGLELSGFSVDAGVGCLSAWGGKYGYGSGYAAGNGIVIGATGYYTKNLTIQDFSISNFGYGVQIVNPVSTHITRSKFNYNCQNGLTFRGAILLMANPDEFKFNTIDQCEFNHNGWIGLNIYAENSTQNQYLTGLFRGFNVTNSLFYHNFMVGIEYYTGTRGGLLAGNHARYNGKHSVWGDENAHGAFSIKHAGELVIRDNVAEFNYLGIELLGTETQHDRGYFGLENITVSNNICRNNHNHNIVEGGGARNLFILNNVIENCPLQDNIYLGSNSNTYGAPGYVDNVMFSGNTVRRGQKGVTLLPGSRNVKILDNTIENNNYQGNADTASSKYCGVWVRGLIDEKCANITIKDNFFNDLYGNQNEPINHQYCNNLNIVGNIASGHKVSDAPVTTGTSTNVFDRLNRWGSVDNYYTGLDDGTF